MKSVMDDFLANLSDTLPWDELDAFAKGKYGRVSDKTYQFVLDEANSEFLIKAALKSLQKTDPGNASEYRAEQLADMMKRFAQNALKKMDQGKSTK